MVRIGVAAAVLVLLVAGCGVTKRRSAPRTPTTIPTTTTVAPTGQPSVPEKKFLDGYHGQTLSALLAMAHTYRTDSILLAIEEALGRKRPQGLSAPERVVLAVEALEREVNGGGYNQFFLNEPSYAHTIVSALEQIDCPHTARITAGAERVLGLHPDWTDGQIRKAAADMSDSEFAKLGPLDDRFYAYPDPIEERLLAFIRANAPKIRL